MTRCVRADQWRFICVLLCITGATNAVRIEKFKVPEFVLDGDSARLVCISSLKSEEPEKALVMKWWWIPLNNTSENRRVIYQRIAGHEPAALRPGLDIGEDDTITLSSTEPTDSGIYECEASVLDEQRMSQMLIVYSPGSGPMLNVTYEHDEVDGKNDELIINCEAIDVAPQPEVVISNNNEILNDTNSVSFVIDGRYNVSAVATIRAAEVTDAIRCDMFFTNEKIPHPAYFTTVPAYEILKLRPTPTTTVRTQLVTTRLSTLDITKIYSSAEADPKPKKPKRKKVKKKEQRRKFVTPRPRWPMLDYSALFSFPEQVSSEDQRPEEFTK